MNKSQAGSKSTKKMASAGGRRKTQVVGKKSAFMKGLADNLKNSLKGEVREESEPDSDVGEGLE